jgi:FixJ family two-component response regulator
MPKKASRIAIVDDDVDVLDSMRFLLELSGHLVSTFRSAAEFIAHCGTAVFDRLILDHHMPRITGLELAKTLRDMGIDLPIMLISGSLTPELVSRAGELGVRVADKPVSEAALMQFLGDPDC